MQEIALQLYRQIKFLREPKAFQAWIFRIATRIAFVHLKRARRWRSIETNHDAIQARAPTPPPEGSELESELLSMIDRLSPASRAFLLLHYQQHLSLEETGSGAFHPRGDGEIPAVLWCCDASRIYEGERRKMTFSNQDRTSGKPEEQRFLERALASVEKERRFQLIKQIAVTTFAIVAAFWLAMKPPSPELNVECTVIIILGLIAGICTAKIMSLINRHTEGCITGHCGTA